MPNKQMLWMALVAGLLAGTVALAKNSTSALTVAVFGDSPYGDTNADTVQTDATNAFIDTINNDPDVRLVLHVGDIHSGKQFCIEAYDRLIYDKWTRFQDPLVYTPGDNEWTDCHKVGEGGHVYLDPPTNSQPVDYADGNPVANLALIRSIFFSNPGHSLGAHPQPVLTQAGHFDNNHPTDGDYVENVIWEQEGVLFVTINLPGGSNNDTDKWYGAAETPAEVADQLAERTARTGADLRWLDAAFSQAATDHVRAVVIQLQADMWDRDGKLPPPDHLSAYEDFLQSIASHTLTFGNPVLLFNGDSHSYRSDNPLKQGQPCYFENSAATVTCSSIPDPGDGTYTPDAWTNHPIYNVPNFHRIVVHGSTHTAKDGSRPPMEWLKLTITPSNSTTPDAQKFGPFRWQRVITALGALPPAP